MGGQKMAKMNYSKFKDTRSVFQNNLTEIVPVNNIEVIPADQVEVLPAAGGYDLSGKDTGSGLGQSIANATSPVTEICNCVKVALDTIEVISKCIAAVSIEKQRTEQIKAMYKAQIIESKEKTLRIKIQEKEETKRLKITCENNLKQKKVDLKKLEMELKTKEKELAISHKEYMANISILQKTLEGIMDTKCEVFNLISQCNGDKETIEIHLHSLYVADEKLVEIAKQVSGLKGV